MEVLGAIGGLFALVAIFLIAAYTIGFYLTDGFTKL